MPNSGGTIEVDGSLNLQSANIEGGAITVAGMFNSTGTSSITDATIHNTGTLKSTSGKLTIDPSTINNTGTLEAAGGELDLTGITTFTNSGLLLATANSLLVLNGDTIDNTGGTVQVNAGSTLDLQSTAISNGTFNNFGLLKATAGTNAIHGADGIANHGGATLEAVGIGVSLTIDANTPITNDGLLEAGLGGTLVIESDVANSGQVIVLNGSTVEFVANVVTGGQIELQASGDPTKLEISGAVTLTGGTVTLTNDSNNAIVSNGAAATLVNHDLISGAGTIGDA